MKIITTGEGGMALTNSSELLEKMQLLRSHGVTRNQKLMTTESEGAWYYQQISLGYNYRMTDIQAALGISQIERIDQFVGNRHKIQQYYDQQLSEFPVVIPYQSKDCYSALHLYPIQIKHEVVKKSHKQIFSEMRESDVGVNVHYIPVHTQPYYQQMGFKQGDYPNAEKYYSRAMSLPMYPSLCSEKRNIVVDVLSKALVI